MKPEQKDIRWEQRFSNFNKALKRFQAAMDITENLDVPSAIADLQKEGLIQRFEYTHELAWNVMKDFEEYQGKTDVKGSRDATREAFKMGLIEDGQGWMDMIETRNDTSHTYNEDITEEIFVKIVKSYGPLFIDFQNKMEGYKSGKQEDILDR